MQRVNAIFSYPKLGVYCANCTPPERNGRLAPPTTFSPTLNITLHYRFIGSYELARQRTSRGSTFT